MRSRARGKYYSLVVLCLKNLARLRPRPTAHAADFREEAAAKPVLSAEAKQDKELMKKIRLTTEAARHAAVELELLPLSKSKAKKKAWEAVRSAMREEKVPVNKLLKAARGC